MLASKDDDDLLAPISHAEVAPVSSFKTDDLLAPISHGTISLV